MELLGDGGEATDLVGRQAEGETNAARLVRAQTEEGDGALARDPLREFGGGLLDVDATLGTPLE